MVRPRSATRHRRGNIKGQVAPRVSLMAGDLVGVEDAATLSVIMCSSDTTSYVPPAAMTAGQRTGTLGEPPPREASAPPITADTTRSRAEAEDPKKLHKCSGVQAERRQAAEGGKEAADASNEAGAASKAPGARKADGLWLSACLSVSLSCARARRRARAHALCLLAHTYFTSDVCSLITPRAPAARTRTAQTHRSPNHRPPRPTRGRQKAARQRPGPQRRSQTRTRPQRARPARQVISRAARGRRRAPLRRAQAPPSRLPRASRRMRLRGRSHRSQRPPQPPWRPRAHGPRWPTRRQTRARYGEARSARS